MALTTLPTAAFATGSVGTSQLADGAVTTEKLVADVNFRNLIINGDMSIAQRGTSTASITGTGYFTIDRVKNAMSGFGTWTQSQSTDVPSGEGFGYSLKYDCTTANASLSASAFGIFQMSKLEGQMLQHLKKGTANAESLTISFWVKSSKTGTYIVELFDENNSRFTNKSYSINSASTWEKKTITFDGDTTGAFNNDNGASLSINFWLGAGTTFTTGSLQTTWGGNTASNRAVGQVNLADNTANEWYITGVQLEVGTSASDFEFLPYDVNLRRCQRYFQVIAELTTGTGQEFIVPCANYNGTYIFGAYRFMPEMRSAPSVSSVSGTDYYGINVNSTLDSFNQITASDITPKSCQLAAASGVSGTAGQAGNMRTNNTSAKVTADAEF